VTLGNKWRDAIETLESIKEVVHQPGLDFQHLPVDIILTWHGHFMKFAQGTSSQSRTFSALDP
jgi:hypothetical protein